MPAAEPDTSSPFTELLIADSNGGPNHGFVRCGSCGSVYEFRVVQRYAEIDERVYFLIQVRLDFHHWWRRSREPVPGSGFRFASREFRPASAVMVEQGKRYVVASSDLANSIRGAVDAAQVASFSAWRTIFHDCERC